MPDKKTRKKKPYRTPEIKAVVYNPRDKVMSIIGCDTGSGTSEIGSCETPVCEYPIY